MERSSKQFDATSYGELLSSSDAATLQEYMRFVVTNGTGSVLNSDLYEAYGKTGTAEFSSNKNEDHSWFVGFAKNAEGKQIAVAVVMGGCGIQGRTLCRTGYQKDL